MTITVAMMEIMFNRISRLNDKSWQSFITNNTDIMEDSLAVLLKYYSKEQLFCNAAKLAVLKPDITPI